MTLQTNRIGVMKARLPLFFFRLWLHCLSFILYFLHVASTLRSPATAHSARRAANKEIDIRLKKIFYKKNMNEIFWLKRLKNKEFLTKKGRNMRILTFFTDFTVEEIGRDLTGNSAFHIDVGRS